MFYLVKHQSHNFRKSAGLVIEKLRNVGSTPDAVARRCTWERPLNAVSLSVVVAQPDERHANRTASVLE